MVDRRCRADGPCLVDESSSGLGRLGGLCLGLRLGLVALLALKRGHVVVIFVVLVFLLILAAQSGTTAELGEVDAAEVAART